MSRAGTRGEWICFVRVSRTNQIISASIPGSTSDILVPPEFCRNDIIVDEFPHLSAFAIALPSATFRPTQDEYTLFENWYRVENSAVTAPAGMELVYLAVEHILLDSFVVVPVGKRGEDTYVKVAFDARISCMGPQPFPFCFGPDTCIRCLVGDVEQDVNIALGSCLVRSWSPKES